MRAMMNQENQEAKLEQNEADLSWITSRSVISQASKCLNASKIHDFGRNFKKK
jgi:hypothetical protein